MKTIIVLALCLVVLNRLEAQVNNKASGEHRQVPVHTNQISLTSVDEHEARAESSSIKIYDPLILTLNLRANGSEVPISNSGIVGMPKRAYGFANGRIQLKSVFATTSGTSTGTPSVGSGNSLGTIGAFGPFIGLNGKSPFAGSAMWGNARGLGF